MPLSIRDAIATWDTDGPLKAYVTGFQTGLAGAQAKDASARDKQRIALQAVAQAESAKARNFNEMMDRMKFGQEKEQFAVNFELKKQEQAQRAAQYQDQRDLVMKGINPRTGATTASTTSGLYPDQYLPEGSSPSGNLSFPSDGMSVSGGGADSSLFPEGSPPPDGSAVPALQPGDPVISNPAGSTAQENVVGDLGSTTAPADGSLLQTAPAVRRQTPEEIQQGFLSRIQQKPSTQASSETPAWSATADAVLESQRARQTTLQQQAEIAAGKASQAQDYAVRSRSMALNRNVPVDAKQQWITAGSNAAKEAGQAKADAVNYSRDAALEAKNTEALAQRVDVFKSTVDDLQGVLPNNDLEKLSKEALALKPSKVTTDTLNDLQSYAQLRQAQGWDYESKGISTARNVVRAYADLQKDEVAKSRAADAEAKLVEAELRDHTKKVEDNKEGSKARILQSVQKELEKRYASLNTAGLLYRGTAKAAEEARQSDIRNFKPAQKKAETPAPPTVPVAAKPAMTPSSAMAAFLDKLPKREPVKIMDSEPVPAYTP